MKDSPTGGGRPLPAICMATGSANAEITRGFCPTLTCVHDGSPIVCTQYGHVAGTLTARHNSSPCADRGQNVIAIAGNTTVRRLTPRECERLQGFPDDYTLVPGSSDSARYKALGNSMAVNVMRWIGKRISNHPANWLS